ncbi:hypothetical protein CIB48_g11271 [Xylaria polymorpha]|nr:hypothetical protein CIB48_g11271 [Xylaria polymorpha]
MSPRENDHRRDQSSDETARNPPSKPARPTRRVVKRTSNAYIEELQRGAAAVFENPLEEAEPETPSPGALVNGEGSEACLSHGDRLSTSTTIGQAVLSSTQHSDCHDGVSPFPVDMGDDGQEGPYTPNSDSESQHLTNPLSTGRSAFSTAGNGFTFYLGTSSNWSFTRRILSITHERIFQAPLPTNNLGFDCMIYELDWGGSRATPGPASPILPSLDFALYLINAVKFHCCQIFHLFDEDAFMSCLLSFYDSPSQQPQPSEELWYVHFLLILAFGKAFTTKKSQGNRPPGEAYFSKALHLLPNMMMLWTLPIEAVEIGQAMRLAMSNGLHTDIGTERFDDGMVERSRRVWWTVYILDREMTSLMGLPQSHHDHGVCPQLPRFLGSLQRPVALSIRIKLSRIMAKINDTVYGTDGQKGRKFLNSTKAALSDIAVVADELRLSFPLEREKAGHGLSRISAHLHLLYHQAPAVFFLTNTINLRNRVPKENEYFRDSPKFDTDLIKELFSIIEVFLPFDLDSLCISTVSAMVAFVIDIGLNANIPVWLQKSYSIFEEFIAVGNRVASFRKSELVQLHELLNGLPPDENSAITRPNNSSASGRVDDGVVSIDDIHSNAALPSTLLPPFSTATDPGGSDISFENLMTTAEMTEIANSIDSLDADWVSQTILGQCNDVNY